MENIKPGVGLVLAGGGGKGAYEIGVWKALEEFGVASNIKAVSGTSVGALNAALFAQGDIGLASDVWSTISPEAVMTLNSLILGKLKSALAPIFPTATKLFSISKIHQWITRRYADQGILSKKGLSHLIDESIVPQRLASFMGPVYVAAYNISSYKLNYFNLKDQMTLDAIKEKLLASASIPVIFGMTYIDGDLYLDGGLPVVGDNVPVKPLYEEGYRNLIVVHLLREEPVDRKRFPDCNIIEIMPQQDLGGMFSGTMNFNADHAKENMQRGYADAVRILEPLFRTGVALNRIQSAFQKISQEQQRFAEQNRWLDDKILQSGREIDSMLEELNKGGNI